MSNIMLDETEWCQMEATIVSQALKIQELEFRIKEMEASQ